MQNASLLFRIALAATVLGPVPSALAQQRSSGLARLENLSPFVQGALSSPQVDWLLPASNLASYIAGGPQFILLGSTKHALGDLTLLSSESFLDALVQGGVKNLFLEIPRSQQSVLDGKAPLGRVRFANLPSGEAQAAAHDALALLIERAKTKGLELIAYDFNNWSGAQTAADIRNDALRCYADGQNIEFQPEDPFAALALHAERLAHDGDAAAFIRSKAGTAKSFIFGGAEHTARADGLAFRLGRSRAAVIHLAASLSSYSDFVDSLELLNLSLPQTLFNEAPDRLLTLDDGMVEPPSSQLANRIHGLRQGNWHAQLCPRKTASLGG